MSGTLTINIQDTGVHGVWFSNLTLEISCDKASTEWSEPLEDEENGKLK